MNNDSLEKIQDEKNESSPLKWLLIGVIAAALIGGGYWYYSAYINKGNVAPTPEVEVTDAPWKTKSEKVTTDFLTFWAKSSDSEEGIIQAKKARDLLTIAAQAKLETFKDDKGNLITSISSQLDHFLGASDLPAGEAGKTTNFEISFSRKIDEETVEVRASLSYATPRDKIFTIFNVGGSWLIDSVKDWPTSPSPEISPTITPTATTSPTPSISPTLSP